MNLFHFTGTWLLIVHLSFFIFKHSHLLFRVML
nr:MAG TPA: hypothetical protein [Caudoviricetes sp.]